VCSILNVNWGREDLNDQSVDDMIMIFQKHWASGMVTGGSR
jgi:hypothetical protein